MLGSRRNTARSGKLTLAWNARSAARAATRAGSRQPSAAVTLRTRFTRCLVSRLLTLACADRVSPATNHSESDN